MSRIEEAKIIELPKFLDARERLFEATFMHETAVEEIMFSICPNL